MFEYKKAGVEPCALSKLIIPSWFGVHIELVANTWGAPQEKVVDPRLRSSVAGHKGSETQGTGILQLGVHFLFLLSF